MLQLVFLLTLAFLFSSPPPSPQPHLSLSLSLSLLFSLFLSFQKLCKDSRICVGLASFFVVIFSIMFSFGIMALLGLTANSICVMLMFVVAGVGVDDCIVVENFYAMAIEQGRPIGSRVGPALQRGGLSVFLTSMSSILAFASGTFAEMPGVVSKGEDKEKKRGEEKEKKRRQTGEGRRKKDTGTIPRV